MTKETARAEYEKIHDAALAEYKKKGKEEGWLI